MKPALVIASESPRQTALEYERQAPMVRTDLPTPHLDDDRAESAATTNISTGHNPPFIINGAASSSSGNIAEPALAEPAPALAPQLPSSLQQLQAMQHTISPPLPSGLESSVPNAHSGHPLATEQQVPSTVFPRHEVQPQAPHPSQPSFGYPNQPMNNFAWPDLAFASSRTQYYQPTLSQYQMEQQLILQRQQVFLQQQMQQQQLLQHRQQLEQQRLRQQQLAFRQFQAQQYAARPAHSNPPPPRPVSQPPNLNQPNPLAPPRHLDSEAPFHVDHAFSHISYPITPLVVEQAEAPAPLPKLNLPSKQTAPSQQTSPAAVAPTVPCVTQPSPIEAKRMEEIARAFEMSQAIFAAALSKPAEAPGTENQAKSIDNQAKHQNLQTQNQQPQQPQQQPLQMSAKPDSTAAGASKTKAKSPNKGGSEWRPPKPSDMQAAADTKQSPIATSPSKIQQINVASQSHSPVSSSPLQTTPLPAAPPPFQPPKPAVPVGSHASSYQPAPSVQIAPSQEPFPRQTHPSLHVRPPPQARGPQRPSAGISQRLMMELNELAASLTPSNEELVSKQRVLDFLQVLVRKQWPDAVIEAYGSSAGPFALPASDIDICMFVDESGAELLKSTPEEIESLSPPKRGRTKPEAGRFAEKQWLEKKEKERLQREERKAKWEQAQAEKATAAAEAGKSADATGPPEVFVDDVAPVEDAAPTDDAAPTTMAEEPPPNLPQHNIVLKLGLFLREAGMINILALPRARIPIVKFEHPEFHIKCDVSLNNRLGPKNTRLLATYAKIDPRLVPLARCIKHWTKMRNINSPYSGTLSSYAYHLLLIFYLQYHVQPPILPVLQSIGQSRDPNNIINGHNCYYYDNLVEIERMGFGRNNRNRSSVAELLIGFFRFYAMDFDFRDDVVCIRLGYIISKDEKEWTRNTKTDRYFWCIEDPFETTHNLGRVADRDSLFTMRGEFMRASKMLTDHKSFAAVCERFNPTEERPAAPK